MIASVPFPRRRSRPPPSRPRNRPEPVASRSPNVEDASSSLELEASDASDGSPPTAPGVGADAGSHDAASVTGRQQTCSTRPRVEHVATATHRLLEGISGSVASAGVFGGTDSVPTRSRRGSQVRISRTKGRCRDPASEGSATRTQTALGVGLRQSSGGCRVRERVSERKEAIGENTLRLRWYRQTVASFFWR